MGEFHDKGYRLIFSHPEMVADLIRHFIKGDWVRRLDFSTLEKVSERDLSPQLVRREKDLLWRLRWYPVGASVSEWLYIFIHLEFQSKIDRFMALREVTYRVLLYEDLVRLGALTASGKLPAVLSITVYNGEVAWDAALSLADLVEPLPGQTAADSILSYTLIDERRYPREMLEGLPGPSSVLFQLEQSRGVEDVRDGVQRLLGELKDDEQITLRRAFATWLAQVLIPARTSTSAVEIPEVRDLMEIKTMLEQRVIQWTQEWKAEGLAKGREEGLAKGQAKGRKEGECRLLQRQLETKFGRLSDSDQQRLLQADSAQLLRWADRVLTAQRIEDVFGA